MENADAALHLRHSCCRNDVAPGRRGNRRELQAMSVPDQPSSETAPGDDAPRGTPGTGENICRRCNGTGRLGEKPCPECEGTGRVVQGIGGA
jgi:hypothetical protein